VSEPAGTRPNEELLREGFAAFSEGRFDDCLKTMHPDVEWHLAFQLPDWPADRSIIYGHAEVRELWGQFTSVWDRLVFDPQELLYDQHDKAIARIHLQAIGGGSGVELDSTLFYAMTFRDGLLMRIRPFETAEAAAGDLGVDPAELR
jgi:ketosteroid isomerase-like protein